MKGPFKFTFEDYADLLAGAELWNAAAGDWPQYILVSVPVTPFVGANDTPATITADSAPSAVPLVVETGVNDTFYLALDGGQGSPELFTMAPGTYSTLAAIDAAVMAATGTDSDTFGNYVVVTDNGTNLVFTMVGTLPAAGQTGNTITEGNGGAAAIGIDAPPALFEGGAGPTIGIAFGDNPELNGQAVDLSLSDAASTVAAGAAYQPLVLMTGQPITPATNQTFYAPASAAGTPYLAKFLSDPGELTQGECYVYGFVVPELFETT